ncbi:PorT family protein [bacterium]|nr:PorT family protein [bacterium]
MKRHIFVKISLVCVCLALAGRPSVYALGFSGAKVPNTPLYDSRMFHFGFSLGMNFLDFAIKNDRNMGFEGDSLLGIRHGFSPGFSVGVVTDLRMGKWFNLRCIPTFSMGSRNIEYKISEADRIFTEKKTVESIMVFVPLEVKWKAARMVDHRPYVTAGVQYVLDMASHKSKKKGDGQEEVPLKLNRHDFGVTAGVGWDFFLPYNNKIAVELKAYFGFLDLLMRDNTIYTDRINRLNNRMLQLVITFE